MTGQNWACRLHNIGQDLRFGFRQLRQSPVVSLAAGITLALGIGATAACFSLVNAWLIRPLPLKAPQELVSVWRTSQESPREPAFFNLYHDYVAWEAGNRTFQSLAATFEQTYALTGAGEPEQLHGAVATWNLFYTVGASAATGRLFLPKDVNGAPACVISDSLWKAHFSASRDVIGQGITLNGKIYRVLGVLPAGFSLRVLDRPFETDVWTLITADDPGHTQASPAPVALSGRLKPGVTPAQAEADLGGMQQELDKKFKGYPPGVGILVTGLQQDNARTVRSSLLLLLAAVSVLLLIACVNAGSLIIGRNSHRAAEFAVRMALGCSPVRLLQQLTIETLILFTVSGAAGVAIAAGLIRLFAATNPLGVLPPGGIAVDAKVLAITVLVVCATSLIFGSIPAFRALRNPDVDPLRSRTLTQGRKHLRSRMFFVGLEFALSVILLVSAGLLISTFSRINAEAPGYDTGNVLVADVSVPYRLYPANATRTALVDNILQRLEQKLSGARAGVALAWPFEVNGLNPIEIEGRHDASLERMPTAAPFMAGPGYFDALAIPVLRGRSITAHDRSDQLPVAVINQEFAREAFPGEDPIGRHLRLRYAGEQEPSEPWLTIVGVVGTTSSIRYNRVQWDRYPALYTSMFQEKDTGKQKRFDSETFYLYISGSGMNARTIASAVHDVAPNLPVGMVRSTGAIVRELRAQPRLRAAMLGSFALFALILAAIGIYGVMTQMVEQRRREIGIRMALGAERVNIVRLVLRRALLLTGFGIVVGAAGTATLTRLLRTLLYDVSPLDPMVFTGVILTLALVAIAGSYLPARSAVAIEPTEALRAE